MSKRILYFGNPTKLRLNNMQIELEQESKTIPIEDLSLIVLDNQQITISSGLISALQENVVGIITCDKRHMPQSLLLPMEGNSIQHERYQAQLNASEPLKKKLWAQTVMAKIKNQATLLTERNINSDYLIPLIKNVKSGDAGNCEATAAAFYWKKLGISRDRNGAPPNNFLNYGYSVLRATMARAIVMTGLSPMFGIFHSNRYNAFCLADDLMEPYRPLVDRVVCNIKETELSKESKAALLQIPGSEVTIYDQRCSVMEAMQHTAVSLLKCFEGKQRFIQYVDICNV